MCEHCNDRSLYEAKRSPLPPMEQGTGRQEWPGVEEDDLCHWFDMDEGADELVPCELSAKWIIEDTHPGDHYCEAHLEPFLAELGQDDGLDAAAVRAEMMGAALLPAKKAEPCDEMVGTDICGRPAPWVVVATWMHPVCDRHADELEGDLGPSLAA